MVTETKRKRIMEEVSRLEVEAEKAYWRWREAKNRTDELFLEYKRLDKDCDDAFHAHMRQHYGNDYWK